MKRFLGGLLVGAALATTASLILKRDVLHSELSARPAAALYKFGTVGSQWDRIATIDGMMDDLSFCADVVELLKKAHPQDQYMCGALK